MTTAIDLQASARRSQCPTKEVHFAVIHWYPERTAMPACTWVKNVLLLVLLTTLAVQAQAEDRPNVVMILGDDQMWTDFGFMGHETIETPNLDQLAREGVLFTHGYVPSSLCRPSLATIITGLYPHQHGITGNDPPKGTDRNEMLKHVRSAATLPKLLGEAGYISFQSGKWWEGNFAEGGFTAGMTHGDTRRGGRHGDVGLKIGREGMVPIEQFLDERKQQAQPAPFFLWYAPLLPHEPHKPPDRLLKKYQTASRPQTVAKYYAMCEWFDETCGDLFQLLEQRGLSENTIVLFVTDNGWIQRTDKPGYAPRSKRSPYDGGIRTPIIVKWPGHIKPGKHETLVSSIDLAPTVLAACGVKAPENLPGINLLDVCAGKPVERDAIYGEIFAHDVADINDPSASLLYRMVLSDRWKLIVPQQANLPTTEPVELFDLAADPHEHTNLAKDQPERVKQLHARLDAWWKGE
jgi:arylsulfatase A-like enzyme